jgi:hypothetical protein
VNILEVFQSLAGKVRTFKTPCYSMLFGALAKTVTAFYAGGHQVVRMAAVTADFFKGKAHSFCPRLQFPDIVCLVGEIARTITAINAAYSNQFPVIFFHTVTYHID